MSEPVKVSVIVPVYRTEKHLGMCLDSILASTLREIEVICINDGSPDGSGAILDSYAARDSRVRVIHQRNQGQGVARNKGLETAKGMAVHFCDSDDTIHPDMYQRMHEIMVRTSTNVVCCGTVIEYEVHRDRECADAEYYKIRYTGTVKTCPGVILGTDVAVWNKIFKKSFLLDNRIWFPSRNYEDLEFFWNWFTSCGMVSFTDDKYYRYVRRAHSFMSGILSGVDSRHLDDFLQAMENIRRMLEQKALYPSYRNEYWRFFHTLIMFHMKHISAPCGAQFVKRISSILAARNLEHLNVPQYRDVYHDLLLLANRRNPLNEDECCAIPARETGIYIAGLRIGYLRETDFTRDVEIMKIITIKTKYYER